MSNLGTANPKDASGRAKLPLHLWPASASALGCIGLLEGELKYGRNNFRATPVAASVYVAAAKRHLDSWFEGEDAASDTGSDHLGNALACLAILAEASTNCTLVDDRNFVPNEGAYAALVARLVRQGGSLKAQFKEHNPKDWDRRDQVIAEQAAAKGLMSEPDNRVSLGDMLNAALREATAAPTPLPTTPYPEAAAQQCQCPDCDPAVRAALDLLIKAGVVRLAS
jgi:hypothetical protein